MPHVVQWLTRHEHDDHVYQVGILLGDEKESKLGEVDERTF
jgi:hypothetical protein